mgnify:CR=1 FL=1|jgi:hypothetical protein
MVGLYKGYYFLVSNCHQYYMKIDKNNKIKINIGGESSIETNINEVKIIENGIKVGCCKIVLNKSGHYETNDEWDNLPITYGHYGWKVNNL